MNDEVITLGGRRFVTVTDLTVGQHLHYDNLVMNAGLRDARREPGEYTGDFEARLLRLMLNCQGMILELLGTHIIPEGKTSKDWTPQMAKETADFLSTVSGKEALDMVHNLFAHVYLDFFEHGLTSSGDSISSSAGRPEEDLQPIDQETDTANGVRSSVSSRAGTTIGPSVF